MRTARSWPAILLAASLLSSVSCSGADFTANYAPDLRLGQASVSVVGVFRDGRLSPEAWAALGKRVSAALGRPTTCPAAFGDELQADDPDLYAKVDEDVKQNGITEEMLALLAPRTDGDLLMTLSVHGRVDLSSVQREEAQPVRQGPNRNPAGPGQMRGRGRARPSSATFDGLEIAASFYSVKRKKAVGRLSMRYTGSSADEALDLFAERLQKELPGAACHGWAFR